MLGKLSSLLYAYGCFAGGFLAIHTDFCNPRGKLIHFEKNDFRLAARNDKSYFHRLAVQQLGSERKGWQYTWRKKDEDRERRREGETVTKRSSKKRSGSMVNEGPRLRSTAPIEPIKDAAVLNHWAAPIGETSESIGLPSKGYHSYCTTYGGDGCNASPGFHAKLSARPATLPLRLQDRPGFPPWRSGENDGAFGGGNLVLKR